MITPSDIIKFQLSDKQWNRGYEIGMARFRTKNKYASTRNLSKINTHVCGAVAEVVFADWQGFKVDETVHEHKGDKKDFISRQIETVDVKHSTFGGFDIELKEKVENIESGKLKDIYVLCRAIVVEDKVSWVHMIGWIGLSDFIIPENVREPYIKNDSRYPWNYVVGLDKLEPFVGKQFGIEVSDPIACL